MHPDLVPPKPLRPRARMPLRAAAVLAALGLLGVASGCSKPVLYGRVVRPDGSPVAGAAVATEPPTDTLVTTELGAFRIERRLDAQAASHPLPEGTYTLKVTKLGYESHERQVQVASGATDVGAVRLKPKRIDVVAPDNVTPNAGDGPSGHDLRGGVHSGD